MALKERFQNPAVGDDIRLRLFTYNSNNRRSVASVCKVDIYFCDPNEITESNPNGLRLVQTFEDSDIVLEEEGQYSLTFNLPDPTYVVGGYQDVWTLEVEPGAPFEAIDNQFRVFSDLWYTTPLPIVYDFSFSFMPNKLRIGSKRFLIVSIAPNVPHASDLERYYANLAIASPIRISIEAGCTGCPEDAGDLIVDRQLIDMREKCSAYYMLDTDELDMTCGIYNVWFEMDFGESRYISEKQQLQIFN